MSNDSVRFLHGFFFAFIMFIVERLSNIKEKEYFQVGFDLFNLMI